MPVSLRIAAGYFQRETFLVWDPDTHAFGPRTLLGRKKRIDAFVSLWHRSSRREHIYVGFDEETADIFALQHLTTGVPYLLSETQEADSWQADDNVYNHMLRCHKVSGPSGGIVYHYPVTVAGEGDDLGPVVMETAIQGFADAELRSTGEPDGTVQVASGEYYLAYSRNLSVVEGDYLRLNGEDYLVMETNSDSGYQYVRAKQETPRFQTVTFQLPSSTPAVFDPKLGRMTGGTEIVRDVSVLIDKQERSGSLPQHQLGERMTLFIYRRHIGFAPALGQTLRYNGIPFTVDAVKQNIEDKQWQVEVTR